VSRSIFQCKGGPKIFPQGFLALVSKNISPSQNGGTPGGIFYPGVMRETHWGFWEFSSRGFSKNPLRNSRSKVGTPSCLTLEKGVQGKKRVERTQVQGP